MEFDKLEESKNMGGWDTKYLFFFVYGVRSNEQALIYNMHTSLLLIMLYNNSV